MLIKLFLLTYIPILFAQDDNCRGNFRSPTSCSGDSCLYEAYWMVRHNGIVEFSVLSRDLSPTSWMAIGFHTTGTMIGSDIVMYNPVSGNVTDKFVTEEREVKDDITQNLLTAKVVKAGRTTVMTFSRKLDTGDNLEDVSLVQCVKFLFPVKPGHVSDNGELTEHEEIPTISDDICLNKC